jgi:hypothetical protein
MRTDELQPGDEITDPDPVEIPEERQENEEEEQEISEEISR